MRGARLFILPAFGEGDRALLQRAVEGWALLVTAGSARLRLPLHHAARAARSPSPKTGRIR